MNREERIRYLSGLILASLLVSLAVLHVTDESVQQPRSKPDIAETDIVMCRILDEARGTVLEEPMTVTSAAMREACERGAAVFIVPDIEIEKLPAAAPQPWENREREVRN